jgi:serine protease SohB
MMAYLFDYLLFLAKAVTVLVAVVFVISMLAGIRFRRRSTEGGHLEVRRMNDRLKDMRRTLRQAITHPSQVKKLLKREAKEDKAEGKREKATAEQRRRLFVLSFDGDLQATRVDRLRNEVTAILTIVRAEDEVIVRNATEACKKGGFSYTTLPGNGQNEERWTR